MLEVKKVPRQRKPLKRRHIIMFVCFVLLIVAGAVGYKYALAIWNDINGEPPLSVKYINREPAEREVSTTPSASALAIDIHYISRNISPGSNARIIILTKPGATCNFTVQYGKDKDAVNATFKAQTIPQSARAEWDWTVSSSTPVGKWPVKVTCTYKGQEGVKTGELIVAAAKKS